MNRKGIYPLVLAVLALPVLSGCDDDSPSIDTEATAVCVDQAGNRVSDSQCHQGYDNNGGMTPFEWYFIMSTLNQPAYGTQVVHNTYYSSTTTNRYAGFKAPSTAPIAKGVPSTGWKPSGSTKAFVPKSQSNITPPKVIQQAPKPMYNPKPVYNKPPAPVRIGRR